MSRLEVICSKLLGKFLLGFHFNDLPKDILFFLILILVFVSRMLDREPRKKRSFLLLCHLLHEILALFNSEKILNFGTVTFLFLFDKYYLIVD